MIARRLSQLFALALAGLTYWCIVSLPGVVDPEFAQTIYLASAFAVGLLFGLLFLALRLTTGGAAVYWGGLQRPDEVARIAALIGVVLAILLVFGWIAELQGRLDETARVIGLLVWSGVLATFVKLGFVAWPARLQSTSTVRLIGAAIAALGLAAAFSYAKFAYSPGVDLPSVTGLAPTITAIVAAALVEEIIFRVLLLTALLSLTQSRFNAVFLSSVVFGLVHAPLALMQPVV